MMSTRCRLSLLVLLTTTSLVHADGSSIDKVYNPYVQPLETELEYRVRYQSKSNGDTGEAVQAGWRHLFGVGRALNERLFAELYVQADDPHGDSADVAAIEAELKWQLSEQGEFDNDWGLLFELEAERDEHVREASTTLIAVHQWNRWLGTANLTLAYEWGNDIDNEWESAFAGQLRYRYQAALEPAIEVYVNDSTQAAGPVLTGSQRFGGRRQLMWEMGLIMGLDKDTPDYTWKATLEYEF